MTTPAQQPYRIQCAQIWGGIDAINTDVVTPGLCASIFSASHEGDRGGDMYYVTVCKWDYLTRIAIADLRGHGGQVSRLSAWIYEALEQRMNSTAGNKVLADLNDKVRERGFSAITTAAVVGYHTTKRKLYFSYAGHPPVFVQKGGGAWQQLLLPENPKPVNLPLGVLPNVKYDMPQIPMEPGDRICLYTDGVTECAGPDGEFFGEERLLECLNQNARRSPAGVKAAILGALEAYRGDCPPDDDVTLVVAEIRPDSDH